MTSQILFRKGISVLRTIVAIQNKDEKYDTVLCQWGIHMTGIDRQCDSDTLSLSFITFCLYLSIFIMSSIDYSVISFGFTEIRPGNIIAITYIWMTSYYSHRAIVSLSYLNSHSGCGGFAVICVTFASIGSSTLTINDSHIPCQNYWTSTRSWSSIILPRNMRGVSLNLVANIFS